MKKTILLALVLLPFCLIAADTDKITVRWVDSVPSTSVGVTFGVPWPRGTFRKGDPVTLANTSGQPLPTQNWVLATWPDGSIKWLALATVVGPECASGLQVLRVPSPAPLTPVKVYHPGIEVFNRVETGAITVDVGDRGTAIIQEMRRAWQLLMAGDGFNISSDINDRPFIVTSAHQPLGNGNIVTPGTWISTNQCAQWGLNAIALLALGGDSLTDKIAAINHHKINNAIL